ncbi:MAG: SHD1 domain-containing protein [Verrucomicrobiota bacterium]
MRPHFTTVWLLAALSIAHGQQRTWTDSLDRKIEATMIRLEAQSVVLKLANGNEVKYPLEKLSAADQKFATEQAKTVATAAATAANENTPATSFDGSWPKRVTFSEDPEIKVITSDAEGKSFIYESANYRYTSDVRLANSVVKGFAVLFEATHLYCRTLPIHLDGGSKHEGKFQIFLFAEYNDYVKAGGPQGSAGVFTSNGGSRVLVPLDSLGVRKVGSGYSFDRDKTNKTLPHELTHQLTPNAYFQKGAMGWFTEGTAEYIAATPYRSGIYNVQSNLRPIIEYVTAYGRGNTGGRALGKDIVLPPLKNFMLMDYTTFISNPQVNYGTSLFLTTYFFQMDGNGDAARMKNFLAALREGKSGEQALEKLLDGRSYEEVEKEFSKAWSRRGIDFSFGK